jgi:hypothetical protein
MLLLVLVGCGAARVVMGLMLEEKLMDLRDEDLLLLVDRGVHMREHSPIGMKMC